VLERTVKAPSRSDLERSTSCVVVMAGPRFGETIRLREGKNVVGSAPDADIYFITVLLSERHFAIVREGKRVFLRREGGITLVNNVSVEEAELKDGDLIFAGGISLRYVEEGSLIHFYLGDIFFGRERREFPRFNMVSTALAYLPTEDRKLDILSIRQVGRGGIGLFSMQSGPVGSKIQVILYSKDSKEAMVAESIMGTVVSSVAWKGALFLVNISFLKPVSEESQPNLYRYLMELQRYF